MTNCPGKGVFLTFEGGDGTGKSTQADVLAEYLSSRGRKVCRVHEPGGTALGEKIRTLLLSHEQDDMVPLAELFLYEAARAQVVEKVIKPAIARGEAVICDRFTDSTVAYQGYGRELGAECVSQLNALATADCFPDRTILLVLDKDQARSRVVARSADGQGDRMESAGAAFNTRMLNGFVAIAAADPERVRRVDASGSIEDVHRRVLSQVADLLGEIDDDRPEGVL